MPSIDSEEETDDNRTTNEDISVISEQKINIEDGCKKSNKRGNSTAENSPNDRNIRSKTDEEEEMIDTRIIEERFIQETKEKEKQKKINISKKQDIQEKNKTKRITVNKNLN